MFGIRFSEFFKNMGKTTLRYVAFTLAEVLIVLGILGIVAEITIPVILGNAINAQYNTGVKDAYALLTQAVNLMKSQDIELVTGGTEAIMAQLCSVLSCTTIDTDYNVFGPNGSHYRYYYGAEKTDWPNVAATQKSSAILKNGYYLNVYWPAAGCSTYAAGCSASLQVDINGKNGPNMHGQDMYRFYILQSSPGSYYVRPLGFPSDLYAPVPGGCTYGSTQMTTSAGCAYKRLFDPSSMP